MQIEALYTEVTNKIIADLERGVAGWLKPWKTGNSVALLLTNIATKIGTVVAGP